MFLVASTDFALAQCLQTSWATSRNQCTQHTDMPPRACNSDSSRQPKRWRGYSSILWNQQMLRNFIRLWISMFLIMTLNSCRWLPPFWRNLIATIFRVDDWGSRFLWNVGNHMQEKLLFYEQQPEYCAIRKYVKGILKFVTLYIEFSIMYFLP